MAPKAGDALNPCSKCGSTKTRVIGQSPSPPASYLQCDACGHISVVPPPGRKPQP